MLQLKLQMSPPGWTDIQCLLQRWQMSLEKDLILTSCYFHANCNDFVQLKHFLLCSKLPGQLPLHTYCYPLENECGSKHLKANTSISALKEHLSLILTTPAKSDCSAHNCLSGHSLDYKQLLRPRFLSTEISLISQYSCK